MKKIIIVLTVVIISIIFYTVIFYTLFKYKEPSQALINEKSINSQDEIYQSESYRKLEEQLTANYNGKTNIKASQVIAAVKKYYTNEELKEISVDGINYSNSIDNVKKLANTINTTDIYSSEVLKTTDGKKITALKFTKNN